MNQARVAMQDRVSALDWGYSIALHVALGALLFWGFWWRQSPAPSSLGGGTQIEFADAGSLSANTLRALQNLSLRSSKEAAAEIIETAETKDVDVLAPEAPDVRQDASESKAPAAEVLPIKSPDDLANEAKPALQVQTHVDNRESISIGAASAVPGYGHAQRRARFTEEELLRMRQLQDIKARRAEATPGGARPALVEAAAPRSIVPPDVIDEAFTIERHIVAFWGALAPKRASCSVLIEHTAQGQVLRVTPLPACTYDDAARRALVQTIYDAQPLPGTEMGQAISRETVVHLNDPAATIGEPKGTQ